MKNKKRLNKKEKVQDMLKIFSQNRSIGEVLSLGYLDIISDRNIDDLPLDKRNNLFNIKSFISSVLSESLKHPNERDANKMIYFLKILTDIVDDFYKGNKEASLFHSLIPASSNDKKNAS